MAVKKRVPPIYAPLFDPGRSHLASPYRPSQYCPQQLKYEDTNIYVISGLNHAASVPAVYASRDRHLTLCKTRFRSVASRYREGVEPS